MLIASFSMIFQNPLAILAKFPGLIVTSSVFPSVAYQENERHAHRPFAYDGIGTIPSTMF